MRAHGNAVARAIAQARGRGAEYYGRELFESDRRVRTFGIFRIADRWEVAVSERIRELFTAFADGANAFVAKHEATLAEPARLVFPVSARDGFPAIPRAAAPATGHDLPVPAGHRLIMDNVPLTLERVVELQADDEGEAAARLVPDLVAAARSSVDQRVREAGETLASWDRRYAADSRGAALYYRWSPRSTLGTRSTTRVFAAGRGTTPPRRSAFRRALPMP